MKLNLDDKRYMQYFAATTATFAAVCFGMMTAWPSPTLPKLQSEDSPIGTRLSDEELSWVVSVALLGSAFGSFISRWGVDYLGRKKTLLIGAIANLIHWIIIIFANSLTLLIVARVIEGAVVGVSLPAVIIYTGEVAEEDIRGRLGTCNTFWKTFGTITILVIGPWVSYTALGIICAFAPILFLCSFVFMPESPFYYVKVGDEEEARKSLVMLSKSNAGEKFINDRLAFIKNTVEEDMKNKGSYVELLTKKKYRWTLFLLFGIKTLQQFNGNMALEGYIQPIIEASDSGLDAGIASIIIGCIQFPAVYLAGLLVDRLGRKPLLITSAALCCVAVVGEGTYFLIQDYLQQDTSALGWLPMAGLTLFWITNPIGVLPLPYVLLGELFPTNIKGAAISFATIYGSLGGFVVTKFFKPLSNSIGMYSVLYIFAGVCLAGVVFVIFFLPETKGKNFQEIQKMLNRRNRHEETEKKRKKKPSVRDMS